MTPTTEALPTEQTPIRLLWLDLTRKCQLTCTHCYNASGPDGTQGTMSREDWIRVLDQAAAYGVRNVQLIGGEPTMHPDFAELVDCALSLGLHVEVFSNLVHVSRECWELFRRDGLSLATSYYSGQSAEHDAVTRRPSHGRTRANIERAAGLGIPLRVGIITTADEQRVSAARRDLESMGVTRIGVDHVRPFGRGAQGQAPDMAKLCGGCGTGTAAVGPDGRVSPCVLSGFIDAGNVRGAPLADILGGGPMAEAGAAIRRATGSVSPWCRPDDHECSPGHPGTECSPKRQGAYAPQSIRSGALGSGRAVHGRVG